MRAGGRGRGEGAFAERADAGKPGRARRRRGAPARPEAGKDPAAATSPTVGDLTAFWGGRNRLLRVTEVAEMLSVGPWAGYQYGEDGSLPHVRMNNAIRIRPRDLEGFMETLVTVAEEPRSHRRKGPPRGPEFAARPSRSVTVRTSERCCGCTLDVQRTACHPWEEI